MTEAGGSDGAGAGSGASGGRVSGRVDSREDVIRVLDLVNDYYRRREPSSPVPMVLERAKAWVTLDFMSVLKDIAPDGIDQAVRVLVQRDRDDD